jgi:hypothetical protein
MATERKYLTTPPAPVRWANLLSPDYRFATQNDPRGTYSIEVLLDPARENHAAILKELENYWASEYEATCRAERKKALVVHDKPWKTDTGDDGAPTGLVSLRPKNKEYFTDKAGKRVNVTVDQFDSQETPIRVQIGNGSTCKVNFEVFAFYHAGKFGLSLRLRAVQVVELVDFDRNYGFEKTSGYVGERYVAPIATAHEAPREVQAAMSEEEVQDGFGTENDELPF